MKRWLASLFLRLMGWKIHPEVPEKAFHSVMVAAPHTSNWDFPFALAGFWVMNLPVRYFIKDFYTKGPWGFFFRWTGAIGVDRKRQGNKLTDYAIQLLRENPRMVILVPAEGTRKKVEKWRTGFYRIALEADVPISMGFLDYKKKEGGVLGVFEPTGEFERDMQYIQEQYLPIAGKYPENYNPQIY